MLPPPLLALLLAAAPPAHAVEGMWEPAALPALADALTAQGYPGDPTRLARLDAAPLGAIVSTGGCTASFVSPSGLLVTNHHCVTGYLQQAQREGENLVDTGFLAPTRADERSAGPTAHVVLTESFTDVTDRVLARIPSGLDDAARKALLDDRTKALVARCEAGAPARRCRVASYYEGLRYSLITQIELRDVRLVMAPPDAVGSYGGQVDNWHWPRHSGDFAFLRAYVGPDGRPAGYSPANVPYTPAHPLALNPHGVGPGAFVMVAGYPGGTDRWQTARELDRLATVTFPQRIARAEATLALFAEVVAEDPSAEPVLNVSRDRVGNSLYNAKGALVGFTRSGAVARAQARDAALDAWIAADPARAARYRAAIDELRSVLDRREPYRQRNEVIATLGRSDLLSAARTLLRIAHEREKPDARRDLGYQDRDLARNRGRLEAMQAGLHVETERRYVRALLLEAASLPPDQRVPELDRWLGLTAYDAASVTQAVDAAVQRLFGSLALDTAEERLAWVGARPQAIEASADGFLSLAVALWPYDQARRTEGYADAGALARLRPMYAEALRAFDPARSYPDANGTLRVTFGRVSGYSPADAVTYAAQTTLEGLAEKAGPWPFDAPPALLEAIRSGARGPYLDPALGSVPVDFLSDLDITGGNSGSPTLDADGRLVGLAFDGNYEGIASDWVFDAPRTRTIHVDIRYLLYYLDAVAGADALLAELGVTPAL